MFVLLLAVAALGKSVVDKDAFVKSTAPDVCQHVVRHKASLRESLQIDLHFAFVNAHPQYVEAFRWCSAGRLAGSKWVLHVLRKEGERPAAQGANSRNKFKVIQIRSEAEAYAFARGARRRMTDQAFQLCSGNGARLPPACLAQAASACHNFVTFEQFVVHGSCMDASSLCWWAPDRL